MSTRATMNHYSFHLKGGSITWKRLLEILKAPHHHQPTTNELLGVKFYLAKEYDLKPDEVTVKQNGNIIL